MTWFLAFDFLRSKATGVLRDQFGRPVSNSCALYAMRFHRRLTPLRNLFFDVSTRNPPHIRLRRRLFAKRYENVPPRSSMKFFCPGSKERGVMIGEMIFSITPRNFLNHNTLTARTTDPTHRIAKENTQSPQRNEFKQPFRQGIIARRRCPADTANRLAVGSCLNFHYDGIFLFVKF